METDMLKEAMQTYYRVAAITGQSAVAMSINPETGDFEVKPVNLRQKMKTADLSGLWLDYWVASAEGLNPAYTQEFRTGGNVTSWEADEKAARHHLFSTDWGKGGEIIERKRISLHATDLDDWRAWIDPNGPKARGETALIAAMRAYVTSVYGDTVADPP